MARTMGLPVLLLLAGCAPSDDRVLLGTVEWDRIELVAEASEPVLDVAVREGETVAAQQVLLRLDPRRAEAALAEIDAERTRLAAQLAEQRHGARPESIDEARARLARARSVEGNAAREQRRVQTMRAQNLVAQAEQDRADTALATARAETRAAQAALDLLLAGTRVEQIEQTEAALAALEARRARAALVLERHTVRAPRAGRVDAIPVEVGDQPAPGAPVVMLLVGSAPYVRAYVPEPLRAQLGEGARLRVTVAGVAQPFEARLRTIRSEASFTPYFALTGDDVSRLVYLAELDLEGAGAAGLPAGLPAQATLLSDGAVARGATPTPPLRPGEGKG